jgi:hypothetical protein
VAVVAGSLVFVGFPSFVVRRDTMRALGSGITLDTDGRPTLLPLPQGQRGMSLPVVFGEAASGSNTAAVAHALWRQPKAWNADDGTDTPTADTLWSAAWNGRTWSPPEQVWRGPGLRWSEGAASNVVRIDSTVYLVVPLSAPQPTGPPEALLLLRRTSRTPWRADTIRVDGALPTFPRLAVVGPATAGAAGGAAHVQVAFLSAMRLPSDTVAEAPPGGLATVDQNSVFTGRLDLSSGRLEALTRLHRGIGRRAVALELAEGRGGPALVWRVDREEAGPAGSVLYTARWRPAAAPPAGGGASRDSAAIRPSRAPAGWVLLPPRSLGGTAERMRAVTRLAGTDLSRVTFVLEPVAGPLAGAAAPPQTQMGRRPRLAAVDPCAARPRRGRLHAGPPRQRRAAHRTPPRTGAGGG